MVVLFAPKHFQQKRMPRVAQLQLRNDGRGLQPALYCAGNSPRFVHLEFFVL